MKICPVCTTENENSADYCSVCGTPLVDIEIHTEPEKELRNGDVKEVDYESEEEKKDEEDKKTAEEQNGNQGNHKKTPNKNPNKFLIGSAAVILLMIGGTVWAMSQKHPGTPPEKLTQEREAAKEEKETQPADQSTENPVPEQPVAESKTEQSEKEEPKPIENEIPAYQTMFVVNCEESTPLREEPAADGEILVYIPFGDPVSFMSNAENGFYEVSYNGETGYALAAYLSTTREERKPAQEEKPKEEEKTETKPEAPAEETIRVINCHTDITLRVSPSTSSAAICKIPLNAEVTFIGLAGNGFYEIAYNGHSGYALASYLTTPASLENVEGMTMTVVNCQKDITLRKIPDTTGEKITMIPLGATVTFKSTAENGFYYIEYDGKDGYALAKYLR